MTSESKKCTKCLEEKPLEGFYNRGQKYKASQCKVCSDEDTANHRKSNKLAIADINRRAHLKIKYGITPEQYDELLDKQGHCCVICDRHADTFATRLCVDHNHKTGEIRGLLCTYCNHRVVGRHRDGDLLRKIADYVDGGTGWFVPIKRRRKTRKASK